MVKFEMGEFTKGIPFLKIGNGPKKAVLFRETEELTRSFVKAPKGVVQQYSLLLPKEYTVYVMGYNPIMPLDETPITIVDRLAPFIRQYIGKAAVIGISYGGPNAICFCARYPDLVSNLILIVTAHKISDQSGKIFVEKAIQLAEKSDHYALAQHLITLASNPLLRWLQQILLKKNRHSLALTNNPLSTICIAYKAAFLNMVDEIKAMLPQIQVPAFVFGGTKDLAFGEKEFRETASLIPNGKVILFEGAGHLVPFEKYFQFRRKLHEILKSLD